MLVYVMVHVMKKILMHQHMLHINSFSSSHFIITTDGGNNMSYISAEALTRSLNDAIFARLLVEYVINLCEMILRTDWICNDFFFRGC